ncbi:MAG TPA: hypothetical protein VJH24_00710 [Candidatus Bilamarchaeaceae archaeon]|nr:hypothetical protein [Candidatus Bilamarchaeaceae archaeon]
MFSGGAFVSSKEIARSFNFPKALSSLYIIPTFFKGIYYVPSEKERKGHFIDKPAQFFSNLFDFAYGRKKWYWSLSTAARHYGSEWSSTKILEIVAVGESKKLDIISRAESLGRKRSYRSRTLSKILLSLGINLVFIHKGKRIFLKEIKIDSELGPVATKERLKKDAVFFLPRNKDKSLRRLYKKYLQ